MNQNAIESHEWAFVLGPNHNSIKLGLGCTLHRITNSPELAVFWGPHCLMRSAENGVAYNPPSLFSISAANRMTRYGMKGIRVTQQRHAAEYWTTNEGHFALWDARSSKPSFSITTKNPILITPAGIRHVSTSFFPKMTAEGPILAPQSPLSPSQIWSYNFGQIKTSASLSTQTGVLR